MADCIKVAIRVRPQSEKELARGCQSIIRKTRNDNQILIDGLRSKELYTFNYVFDIDDTQQMVYESAVEPLLPKLFEGYNVTMVAYGQTGSGKTFTMGTNYSGVENDQMGIIPRAAKCIFEKIDKLTSAGNQIDVQCSFVELYMEQVFDLLSSMPREQCILEIREEAKEIKIPGLTELSVGSIDDLIGCLRRGSSVRKVGSTAMNSESSRSHAIFTVKMKMVDVANPKCTKVSRFHLVDLAGSERSKKTMATGDRFKEGVKINQGLSVLGNVISLLGNQQTASSYIPYRESKLTRLLQDSLGGNSLTVLIACVSPSDYNLEETINTIRYADRAKNIKNKPMMNLDATSEEIEQLKATLQQLRIEFQQICDSTFCAGVYDANGTFVAPADSDGGLTEIQSEMAAKKSKILSLQNDVQNMVMDVIRTDVRVENAEELNTTLIDRATKLKDFVDALDLIRYTFDDDDEVKNYVERCQNLVNNLRDFVKDMSDILLIVNHPMDDEEKPTENDDNHESRRSNSEEDFSKRTMACRNQLTDLTKNLMEKEELQVRIQSNLLNYISSEDVQKNRENIEDIKKRINTLQGQRDQLEKELKNTVNKINTNSTKLAEDRRKKIEQLEVEILKLIKKSQHQKNILELKEAESERLKELRFEIQEVKQEKVRLLRSMKKINNEYKKWKNSKDREIRQLKEKERKQQGEITKLNRMHTNKQNVLKRKYNEVMAQTKRLESKIEKQKNAQIQRRMNATASRIDFDKYLDHEFEVCFANIDNKILMENLIDERTTICQRIDHLKETPGAHNKSELKDLEKLLQVHNEKIAKCQKNFISNVGSHNPSNINDAIHNLSDAKKTIKYQLKLMIDLKKQEKESERKNVKLLSTILQDRKRFNELSVQETELKRTYHEKVNRVEREEEAKLSVLYQELLKRKTSKFQKDDSGSRPPGKSFNVHEEAIKERDALRAQLEELKEKNLRLKQKRDDLLNFKKPFNSQLFSDSDIGDVTDTDEADDYEKDPDWQLDNQKITNEISGCHCTTNCSNKRCKCRKQKEICGDKCACVAMCCLNRSDVKSTVSNQQNLKTSNENGFTMMVTDENDIVMCTPNMSKSRTFIKPNEVSTINDNEESPKRLQSVENILDVTTPSYPYSVKKRKPFLEF